MIRGSDARLPGSRPPPGMPASVRAPALRGAPGPTLGSLHGKVHERSTGRAPVTHRAHGQTAASTTAPASPALVSVVESLFKFPPVWRAVKGKARQDILDRAKAMGLDWWGMVEELKQWDGWGPLLKEVTDPLVDTPEYYKQPFHGYDQGNLSWEAAFEVTAAAISVHSFVMDPKRKVMDPEGDLNLRKSYGEAMQALLSKVPARKVKDILDIGCSTGLSSKELLRTFPSAKVTGIDLSPYFLAVARHEQMQQLEKGSKKEPIAYVHAAAERTGLPNACMDLVSICLVLHELPGDATKAVIAEAHRILRPRGILAIMEMNPWSERFERVLNNPFAYAGFKSTEPYLNEYINLDLHAAIQERGFQPPSQVNSSPAHFTLVAMKQ